ncbi:MAG TPA: hypothetical protein DCZ12_03805 [Gammaproteobacteria bacterium]|nr:hypothetical protein [Gammaproteobacteria bacterium]
MFVVLLRFAENKSLAGQFMAAHNTWISEGIDAGLFLVVGSLQPQQGGAVLVHNTSLAELQERVNADPFVREGVVKAEILEMTPVKTDARLNFLLDESLQFNERTPNS